jgi:hypothetical protein
VDLINLQLVNLGFGGKIKQEKQLFDFNVKMEII